MRALVRMNGGRVMRRLFGVVLVFCFLAFTEAQNLFQAGLETAEHGGFLGGVFGAAGGGHKRVSGEMKLGLSASLPDNANPQRDHSFIA
jgi:hypothetical protein